MRQQSDPRKATSRRGAASAAGATAGAGAGQPAGPPLSSRIIRAVNAFDDLVGSSADPGRAASVVDRLRLDASAQYDPEVVSALGRIITRRSVLPA